MLAIETIEVLVSNKIFSSNKERDEWQEMSLKTRRAEWWKVIVDFKYVILLVFLIITACLLLFKIIGLLLSILIIVGGWILIRKVFDALNEATLRDKDEN